MSDGRSWQGNWKARLYERVRERGYDSLTAFAEARPTASLVALAEELGKDDVAGVQVFSGLVAEAERSHQVTRLVRGQARARTVREPPQRLAGRAGRRKPFRGCHGARPWTAYTPETHKERVKQARASAPRHAAAARLAPARARRRAAPHAPSRRGSLNFTDWSGP